MLAEHKIFNGESILRCSYCQSELVSQNRSLVCQQGHTFDIAKSGYVNLAPQAKPSKEYDKTTFLNRRQVFLHGFYKHILDAVQEQLNHYDTSVVLDAGCGEGYYANHLTIEGLMIACDLSKEAVTLAAKQDVTNRVCYVVADLARLPLKDRDVSCVIDIYSPANYTEFERVLNSDGIVIKVVPTENHVKEIRQIMAKHLEAWHDSPYSNDSVSRLFSEKFDLLQTLVVEQTILLTDDTRELFMAMTPLLFSKDTTGIDWSSLTEVTVSGMVLVGRKH